MFIGKLKALLSFLEKNNILILRIALGIVYVWFGALKILGVSPVEHIITASWSFLPEPYFMIFLGVWEVAIGIGFIFGIKLVWTVLLMWLQMGGIFTSPILNPNMFFAGNPLFVTFEGEFVIKNLVLLAASITILTHELKKHQIK